MIGGLRVAVVMPAYNAEQTLLQASEEAANAAAEQAGSAGQGDLPFTGCENRCGRRAGPALRRAGRVRGVVRRGVPGAGGVINARQTADVPGATVLIEPGQVDGDHVAEVNVFPDEASVEQTLTVTVSVQ